MKKKVKALVLFSGGLDSMLAVEILRRQGIEVIGLLLTSCFFDSQLAKKAAKKMGLKLKIIDISKEHLQIVKSPKHGYGKGMNPCIDCHTLMLRQAREIIKKEKVDFVATGEVIGERPMSQRKNAMKIVEKESGLQGLLVRPLSAQLIQMTLPGRKGLLDYRKLYAISGRSRKEQIKLAEKFGLEEYPSPAGGCLLTDPDFSQKLRLLLKKYSKIGLNDIELLKNGRQFWEGKTRIVVGRDEKENKSLKKLARAGDVLVELKNIAGPTALIRAYPLKKKIPQKIIEKAEDLVKRYALKTRGAKKLEFKIKQQ